MSANYYSTTPQDRSSPGACDLAVGFGGPHPHAAGREETRPDVIARLEWLDDLIFAAIDGDAVALDAAGDAWRQTLAEFGPETVEESRQQYVRRAQQIWQTLRKEPDCSRRKVLAAIQIISLLSGREPQSRTLFTPTVEGLQPPPGTL